MDRYHIVCIDEAHFDIDLSELSLSVCAGVFIPEATHNLIILVDTADHKHLLEELGRLRQCVKTIFEKAAWNEEIPCAFRCAFCKHGCFDIPETE